MRQQDLVEIRLWIKENTNQIRKNKVAIHPADVHYYEEYLEEDLDQVKGGKTVVRLYSGEPIIILSDFDIFLKKMTDFRELSQSESLLKGRN